MERITPYATPVSRSGRILFLALAAVGLAGAGMGIAAVAWTRPPAAPPAPVVVTTEATPPKPADPAEAPSPWSAEAERLQAEERARQQAAWDALRQVQADRQAEAQRRALEDERRRLEDARRRLAERTAVAPQLTGVNLWAVAPTVHGPYPRTIPFAGWVTVDGPTTVRYRFVGSDGTVSPPRTLICPAAGRYAVNMPWRVTAAGSGSVTLEVLDPTPITTTATYTAAP